MAATKQFLLNYDSNILLPYTTLDCILGDENADLEQAGNTGIDVITDRLLENIKQFVYRNTDKLDDPTKLDSNKIGDASAFVLGLSALREGGTQYYTKFHQLTLDSPGHAGQYLGADGANHEVKFDASFTASDNWYSTAIEVKPSFNLDNPIDASISMSVKTSSDCFEIRDGNLYSKYSTKATESNVSKFAYHANKIATVTDASAGDTTVVTIGSNIALQLNNGDLTAIKKIGAAKQPIYIAENGTITTFTETEGTSKRPIYLNGGVLTACNDSIGSTDNPMYYEPSTGFARCTGNAGANDQIGYIENGVFKTSTITKGSDLQPIYISNGKFIASNGNKGLSNKPIYMQAGVIKESTSSLGKDGERPIFMEGGEIKQFTNLVPTLSGSATVGGIANPVYIKDGIVTGISDTVCGTTSNELMSLTSGTFQKQTGGVGSATQPVYVTDGTITVSNANVGDVTIPVYLNGGTISQCELTPSSITGADAADGGTLFLQSIDGVKQWAVGNKTTKGDFSINATYKYYLVGILDEDSTNTNVKGDSFECLTGAKRADGTGIYFKNYELFQTSDENLKTFTGDIDINFDNLATIKKGIYHWTDDPNKISDIGIGARSLEALYPEIVDENNGVKTVAYNRLGVIALAAIDKLHLRVKELETEMKELKAEIRTLKQGK